MSRSFIRLWIPALLVLLGASILVSWLTTGPRAGEAFNSESVCTPTTKLPPATNLRIVVTESPKKLKDIFTLDESLWKNVKAAQILLNRTPRIYQSERPWAGSVPELTAQAIRSGNKITLRLQWDDPTKNVPEAPVKKTGTGGDPKQLYKKPTRQTATFSDAIAVMVPKSWKGPSFPSLQMGDKQNEVNLYYWNPVSGGEVMAAIGRATTKVTGGKFKHLQKHEDGKWTVVLQIPDRPEGDPMAFAIWQGEAQDRDGLKFFSVWYVLEKH